MDINYALNRFHVVSPLALVAFRPVEQSYSNSVGGAVVNGPLNSALVFLDYDFDGILDADEPSARTNQFGEYELTSTRKFMIWLRLQMIRRLIRPLALHLRVLP